MKASVEAPFVRARATPRAYARDVGRSSSPGISRVVMARLAAAAVLALACTFAIAQQESGTPKKPDPPILIGPSRVTLAGGKTLEAIAVFREPGRVRVVLEDDTEIVFDPAKVVSVVALADLPDTPPLAPKAAAKTSVPAGKKGGKPAAAPAKVHAEPAGNGKTASTRPASADAADGESVAGGGTGDDAAAKAKAERERDVEELAGMLQAAIANAAFEGGRTGGPDEGSSPAADAEKNAGKDATQAAEPDGSGATGALTGEEEKKTYKPRPEDFDATRPVNKAGFRFLGPKGNLPETPPQADFPKPAAPVTSLGFGVDTWRPSSGFSSTAKWGTALAPATSFSNRLTGLDPPITSFGPRWWGPTPTKWPTSIFPEYWQPRDGFAQSQEQKNPPPPPAKSTTSEENK
jgi:hypothetical protein